MTMFHSNMPAQEIVDFLSDTAFRVPSSPYPERTIWWQVDYIDDDGNIVLKQATHRP